jgi:hypothetical protein
MMLYNQEGMDVIRCFLDQRLVYEACSVGLITLVKHNDVNASDVTLRNDIVAFY